MTETKLLPQRWLCRLFSTIDVWALCKVQHVCKRWSNLIMDLSTWERSLRTYITKATINCCKIQRLIQALKKLRAYPSASQQHANDVKKRRMLKDKSIENTEYAAEDTRLDYVKRTVELITKYLQRDLSRFARKEYCVLLALLNERLAETYTYLEGVQHGLCHLTINFDVYELVLRRYFSQLTEMFPLRESSRRPSVSQNPSLIIADQQARSMWIAIAGQNAYFCSFERFYSQVIDRRTNEVHKNHEAKQYFSYFLNFPEDGIVTTYKWHILVALFGPYDQFFANFKKYILGQGFLGLVNRLHAEELLKDKPKRCLMRFSRTNPTCMAFSYNTKGYVAHITNNSSWWDHSPFKLANIGSFDKKSNVPIAHFMSEMFSKRNYELVQFRVSAFDTNETDLMAYASNASAYLSEPLNFSTLSSDEEEDNPLLSNGNNDPDEYPYAFMYSPSNSSATDSQLGNSGGVPKFPSLYPTFNQTNDDDAALVYTEAELHSPNASINSPIVPPVHNVPPFSRGNATPHSMQPLSNSGLPSPTSNRTNPLLYNGFQSPATVEYSEPGVPSSYDHLTGNDAMEYTEEDSVMAGGFTPIYTRETNQYDEDDIASNTSHRNEKGDSLLVYDMVGNTTAPISDAHKEYDSDESLVNQSSPLIGDTGSSSSFNFGDDNHGFSF
mmetsp:Transcript_22244/g.24828  ORF Transcript_22244/g.24828 Transcript_22244/m.24828 type:complete len:668 (+) Transcript_22244:55-2058(+)